MSLKGRRERTQRGIALWVENCWSADANIQQKAGSNFFSRGLGKYKAKSWSAVYYIFSWSVGAHHYLYTDKCRTNLNARYQKVIATKSCKDHISSNKDNRGWIIWLLRRGGEMIWYRHEFFLTLSCSRNLFISGTYVCMIFFPHFTCFLRLTEHAWIFSYAVVVCMIFWYSACECFFFSKSHTPPLRPSVLVLVSNTWPLPSPSWGLDGAQLLQGLAAATESQQTYQCFPQVARDFAKPGAIRCSQFLKSCSEKVKSCFL